MQRKIRILVIEDEAAIRTGLVDVFVFHGYETEAAAEGPEGLRKALDGTFDLIVLDLMLPGMDGYEICRRIRSELPEQPIIMLTAKTRDEDVINGLSLGADDYIAKPFSVAEMVLRVQAVLRRSRIGAALKNRLRLGEDLEIDIRNLAGRRGKVELSFTPREMAMLQYLGEHTERAVSREELLSRIWGYGKHLNLETRTVDIHIAKLRRKIEPDPSTPRYLVTVRGAGYRLLVK